MAATFVALFGTVTGAAVTVASCWWLNSSRFEDARYQINKQGANAHTAAYELSVGGKVQNGKEGQRNHVVGYYAYHRVVASSANDGSYAKA